MQSIDGINKPPGSIKRFVQDILGCTCPDRVFEQIEDKQELSATSPHTRTIIVGGRLLIYIWKVDGREDLRQGVLAMLTAGRQERDACGLNRFRAVLAVDTPPTILPQVNRYLSQFEGRDDRMHIHVVSVDDLKNF